MCTMLIMYCKHLFGITSVDIVHKQVLVRYQMGQIHKGVSLKHSHETGYLKNYIFGENG